MKQNTAIRVLLCTQQPFLAAGVASILSARKDLKLTACCDSLNEAVGAVRSGQPDIVLVHLGSRTSLAELGRLWSTGGRTRVVLWGDGIGGEFAFQAMLLGVRAILPARTSIEGMLASLINVHRGVLCFDKESIDRVLLQQRVTLTRRQGQIVSLVAQGYKNKAIGAALGITEGTVKVYLYKLFKKLGVNDRLDMALYGLRNLFAGEPQDGRDLPREGSEILSPLTLPSNHVN